MVLTPSCPVMISVHKGEKRSHCDVIAKGLSPSPITSSAFCSLPMKLYSAEIKLQITL